MGATSLKNRFMAGPCCGQVDRGAQEGVGDEAQDVRGADVEPLQAVDDDRAEDPDDQHRPDGVAPLDAQAGDRLRREEEERDDGEVRRVPGCRPSTRTTYFDVIAIMAASA